MVLPYTIANFKHHCQHQQMKDRREKRTETEISRNALPRTRCFPKTFPGLFSFLSSEIETSVPDFAKALDANAPADPPAAAPILWDNEFYIESHRNDWTQFLTTCKPRPDIKRHPSRVPREVKPQVIVAAPAASNRTEERPAIVPEVLRTNRPPGGRGRGLLVNACGLTPLVPGIPPPPLLELSEPVVPRIAVDETGELVMPREDENIAAVTSENGTSDDSLQSDNQPLPPVQEFADLMPTYEANLAAARMQRDAPSTVGDALPNVSRLNITRRLGMGRGTTL